MRGFLIFLTVAILANTSYGQGKSFSYQIELGTLLSVGPTTYKTDSVRINNLTQISYFDKKRFEHPSARLRISILYEFVRNTEIGIESGISLRFGESFYNDEVLYSIPLQGKIVYYPIELKKNILIGIDGSAGYHFRNYYKIPVTEQGGFIFSISSIFAQKKEKALNWFVKFGFEKQIENNTRKIIAREPGQKEEYYKFKTNRNQVLISLGIKLH